MIIMTTSKPRNIEFNDMLVNQGTVNLMTSSKSRNSVYNTKLVNQGTVIIMPS